VRERSTLFNAFAVGLAGKTVLVVSPFSRSIEANFDNRFSFFKNYYYPRFNLVTMNTPITYSGLPLEFYPHNDWFETLASLKEVVRTQRFDIALLACGSYAVPLGRYIEKELGRQAIYVGGVLQLFFGIMGRRYDNQFFLDQINLERFIWPVEKDRYFEHVTIDTNSPREAFGAYF